MALAVLLGAAQRRLGDLGAQILGERLIMRETRLGLGAVAVELAGEYGCGHGFAA